LLGDKGDRNVVDIDFAFLDEMQQQIERSLEIVDPDLVGQLRLLRSVELVIHKALYTSFGGIRASLSLLLVEI
jgi:hypothetical protein